jgi:hypothetical protein
LKNRRWPVGRVRYVTFNAPHSCNNPNDTNHVLAAYGARHVDYIKWPRESVAKAKASNLVGLMIIAEANPAGIHPISRARRLLHGMA